MSTATFKALFETSPLGICMCDQDGYIKYYNESAANLWGRKPDVGKERWSGAWKMFAVDGSPISLDDSPMAQCIRLAKSFSSEEITIQRPDHSFCRLKQHPQLIKNEQGNITGAYNTLVDISHQNNIAQYQSVLSAIVESSDDAIISKNLQGVITSWNQAAQKIFGYTAEEIIGQSINKLIPAELHGEEKNIIENIRNGRKVDHFQTIRLTKSGKLIHVSLTASPVKDANGVIIGASKIARDISMQLQREAALAQSAERLSMINSIGRSISEKLDVHSILQNVTDATTNITGSLVGAFFYNMPTEQGDSQMLHAFSGIAADKFEGLKMPAKSKDFSKLFNATDIVLFDDITTNESSAKNVLFKEMPAGYEPVKSYLAVPITSGSGVVIGGLFFAHSRKGIFQTDHAELIAGVASQAAVALDNSRLFEQVSNLNSKKDEFIALASHELKTPITTIKGYLQILQKKEDDTVKLLFLNKCLTQVNQLNKLVADLFDISRIEAGKLHLTYEKFDLKEMLNSIVEPFYYSSPSHKIVLNYNTETVLLNADKLKIEQVITNLLTNAIKYSPGADKVEITVETSGQILKLAVKDRGLGLSKEQQKKIFTRFYRVEGDAHVTGLGLGLYLSKEIMDRHKGGITVTSELGKGSEFVVWMPL